MGEGGRLSPWYCPQALLSWGGSSLDAWGGSWSPPLHPTQAG